MTVWYLVALVERVEDQVLVEADVLGVRRGLGLGRGVREGCRRGRALGLEALGEEGVAGAQMADGPRERRLRRVDPAATSARCWGPAQGVLPRGIKAARPVKADALGGRQSRRGRSQKPRNSDGRAEGD
jgi:hypothetical protein